MKQAPPVDYITGGAYVILRMQKFLICPGIMSALVVNALIK
jgi:hypothetical protein